MTKLHSFSPIQYYFDITRDETEVMLSLYQKDVRDQRGLKASAEGALSSEQSGMGENLTIGFLVMKVMKHFNVFLICYSYCFEFLKYNNVVCSISVVQCIFVLHIFLIYTFKIALHIFFGTSI